MKMSDLIQSQFVDCVNQLVCLHCSGSDDTFLNKDSTETHLYSVSSSVTAVGRYRKFTLGLLGQVSFTSNTQEVEQQPETLST